MTTTYNPQDLIGTDVVDSVGDKVGKVGNVYVADETHQPQWVTVRTGLFGHKESFVPLAGAKLDRDGLHVSTTKDMVKSAPQMSDDGRLSETDGAELYSYYGVTEGKAGRKRDNVPGPAGPERSGDRARGKTTGGESMIRSEEQLKVGTQEHEAGRVRLRKHVVTEEQQVTVPVRHEELRVEREPITDGDRIARGAQIGEQEQEVVLHEERPVVDTSTVPVEKVRLGKETVTEDQTVRGKVRKERVDIDDDHPDRRKR